MNILANLFSQTLYIDPAATSILLTSITAVAVAVGASAIVIWRKLKKKVSKTLNIDPNKGKEVEDELVMNDETVSEDQTANEVSQEVAATEEVKDSETK